MKYIISIAWILVTIAVSFGQTSDVHASLDTIFPTSLPENREKAIQEFVASPNPVVSREIDERLQASIYLDDTYKASILEIVEKMHETSAIPILVTNITSRNHYENGILGAGRSSFASTFPYADCLIEFGDDGLPDLLKQVTDSNDPTVADVAESVIGYMGRSTVPLLINEYIKTKKGSNVSAMICRCIKTNNSVRHLNEALDILILEEQAKDRHDRLLDLKSEINAPLGH